MWKMLFLEMYQLLSQNFRTFTNGVTVQRSTPRPYLQSFVQVRFTKGHRTLQYRKDHSPPPKSLQERREIFQEKNNKY